MIDARHYAEHETLRNGMQVLVRALQPDDGERIAEAFSMTVTSSATRVSKSISRIVW